VIQPLAEKAIAMALAPGLQPQSVALSVEALRGGVYWVKGGAAPTRALSSASRESLSSIPR